MKRFASLLCTLMVLMSMHAAQQQITIANYSVRADAANNAVFYSLQEADSSWGFNFYIYLEEGKHDLEWGKTYTTDDMNSDYCYWQKEIQEVYGAVSASLTKTKGDGYSVNITAYMKDTEGREFQLTYTEEPLVLTGDTVKAVFEKPAVVTRNNDGTWQIEAGNDTLSCRAQYYSSDEKSCAGTFAGDEVYLPACYTNVFTGKYEYGVPLFDRIFAKDVSAVVTEDEKRIDAHAVLVCEDGVVYDFTMAFEKPEIVDRVTITSDSLLIETWGYERFGTIQMSASDSQHKVIFWYEPAGLDSLIAGTYTVGEKQFDGWVINLETGKESSLYSGSVTVTYDDGAYYVEGALLCKNNVEYTLHLGIAKPTPTREETIVFERAAMSIDETGWGAYGDNSDHTKFISIFAPTNTVAGTYTEEDLVEDYCFIGTDLDPEGGTTNQYYTMKEADLTVTFNAVDSVAHITGTMFCINTQDPNDRPLFTIDVTTAMDGPFFDDATDNFAAEFETYEINDLMVEDVGSVLVEAYNYEDSAFVALQIFVEEGAKQLTAGTYPLTLSEEPKTALASRGMYGGYATYSIAGYANENSQFYSVWFLVSGNVTVSENGTIEVEAVNSNGKTVYCRLNKKTEAIEIVETDDSKSGVKGRKEVRENMLIIKQNGRTYNAQGAQIQ